MFGNKCFDMDDVDNIIIDGVRYASTVGFQLIFKRIPDDLLYTEDDKHKSMLLATNAHKHHSQGRVLSNRRYVIAPLMSIATKKQKKSEKELPHATTV